MNVELKYIFTFPEEQEEFETIHTAFAMKSGMYSFENYLRSFKHRDLDEKSAELLEEIKEKYYECFEKIYS
jgi:hypothetical protein